MPIDLKSIKDYLSLLDELSHNPNISHVIVDKLMEYTWTIHLSDLENGYSKPMVWIGMYIALASLFCVLAMLADLIHGLRSRKFWFPCKYFTIDAFSLSVIAVAMKLPVDLSSPTPSLVDQATKLGSMAFMCTMMANLLPCLATMDTKALFANITASAVVVITLVVNVCIQMQTRVIVNYGKDFSQALEDAYKKTIPGYVILPENMPCYTLATIYVPLLLMLLIIHVCSSLAIIKSKEIIEMKYQKGHERATKALQQSGRTRFLTVAELQQHVSNYWIMAASGSPQFIITCFVTTCASGVISASTTILHTFTISWFISSLLLYGGYNEFSEYKWSMWLILKVQLIGVVLGSVAPLFRCFATLRFKLSFKSISNHMKVFRVESYWTQKLSDWKHGSIRIPFRSRKLKVFIKASRNLILNLLITFQEGVVVLCKIIGLIPFFFMICILYPLNWSLHAVFSSSTKSEPERSPYVLELENENEMELAANTLNGLTISMNRLIQNGEKKQPNNLKKLILEKCTKGFQGVIKFDKSDHLDHVHGSPVYRDCWSLPVVTLTTIVVTLPNIEKAEVESLMRSVREGLEYVSLVEKNLNATDDYVSIQKAAETLWQEVDVCHTWLGDELQDNEDIASQVDPTWQIVQLFLEKAKNKINQRMGSTDNDSMFTSICANSMYRITETIIANKESQNRLFDELSSWIADIMAACLTNLPRVIAMKCHTSVIEKREACVQVAAQLLGETKEIINTLQDPSRHVPSMNPDDLPFIDKWRASLRDP